MDGKVDGVECGRMSCKKNEACASKNKIALNVKCTEMSVIHIDRINGNICSIASPYGQGVQEE